MRVRVAVLLVVLEVQNISDPVYSVFPGTGAGFGFVLTGTVRLLLVAVTYAAVAANAAVAEMLPTGSFTVMATIAVPVGSVVAVTVLLPIVKVMVWPGMPLLVSESVRTAV